jgi:pyroglutamyl-peptidase
MNPTTLLTGFAPFDGAALNSSWEAVTRVRGIPGLITAELPVEFGRASELLAELIAAHRPDVVIAVGLAGDRRTITPEKVAINVEDARIPDNAGAQPVDRPVVAGGPDAYFSGLPVAAIAEAVRAAGVPSEVSLSAGTFVCNSLMYRLMHEAPAGVVAGFIHVPSEAVMDVDTIARGLEIAVATTVDNARR